MKRKIGSLLRTIAISFIVFCIVNPFKGSINLFVFVGAVMLIVFSYMLETCDPPKMDNSEKFKRLFNKNHQN